MDIAKEITERTYQPRPGKPLSSKAKPPSAAEAREELEFLSLDSTWGRLVMLYAYRPGREAFKASSLEPAISWRAWLELEAERLLDCGRHPRFRWRGDEVALYAEDPLDRPSRLQRIARLAARATRKRRCHAGQSTPLNAARDAGRGVPSPGSGDSAMEEDGAG